MPGQIGNFAVAGHRVTYGKPFNEIATIKPGDAIVIETATTWYVYRAVRHVIVTPEPHRGRRAGAAASRARPRPRPG